MPRPRNVTFDLKGKLAKLADAGFSLSVNNQKRDAIDDLLPLDERIKMMLGIIRERPLKSGSVTYLIMYDITSNKVRRLVAKYLLSKGCMRIQKSVFMTSSSNPLFQEIFETLKDVNSYYENQDSIVLVPVNVADVRSMKVIGKNLGIDIIVDPPTTIFF
jgi:CRISPR-associated endonuclease Cas2